MAAHICSRDLRAARFVSEKTGKQLGTLRALLFHPRECRVVGVLVRRPDVAWMFGRSDLFAPLSALDFSDPKHPVVLDASAVTGAKAERALEREVGAHFEETVIWSGMDVVDSEGAFCGRIGSVEFDPKSGQVAKIELEKGSVDKLLLGRTTLSPEDVKGFERGIGSALNRDEGDDHARGGIRLARPAAELAQDQGLAEKAGRAYYEAAPKVRESQDRATATAGRAIEEGSRAAGRQVSRLVSSFGAFKEEFDKARNGDE